MGSAHDNDERPAFARPASASPVMVELRGECPRRIVDVLDAVSMARDKTRTALVNEILDEWAQRVLHEHSLLARVVGVIPAASGANGGPSA